MKKLRCLGLLLLVAPALSALADQGEKAQVKPAFQTQFLKRGALLATVRAIGTVQPEEFQEVGAQINGRVQKFGADPKDPNKTIDFGTEVAENTVLAELDPTFPKIRAGQATAVLERAKAELLLSEAVRKEKETELARAQKLLPTKAISQQEFELLQAAHEVAAARVAVSKAQVGQAKIDLEEAELKLRSTKIISPIKGIIIDRRVTLGQVVTAGSSGPALFLIGADLKKVLIWAVVTEADIGQVKAGQKATFTVEAFPGRTFKGEVRQTRLNATITKESATYTVVLSVANADLALLPYLTAQVHVEVGTRKAALLAPTAALRWKPRLDLVAPEAREAYFKGPFTQDYLWVEDKGYVRPIPVDKGSSDGTLTEIIGGEVREGTAVVIGHTGK